MPSFKVRWEGGVVLHPPCPGGVSPEDSPTALAKTQEFSRTISTPVYLTHYFSVCSAGSQCHQAPLQCATAPCHPSSCREWGSTVRAALPAANVRGRHAWPPKPCQILPWTAGPRAAPHQPPGPAWT